MDTAENINHALSFTHHYIYNKNYRRMLPFMKELLDIICSPYKYDKGIYAEFEVFFYAVMYVNPEAKLSKTK